MFFLTTSASGFFVNPLSSAGRIVVTATEADLEINETVFPLALARVLGQSLDTPGFDVDRDGAVSMFDLYIAVVRDVADRYQKAKSIPTEHAQLDDNGDGRSSEVQIDYLPPDQGGRPAGASRPHASADGVLAARTWLADNGDPVEREFQGRSRP